MPLATLSSPESIEASPASIRSSVVLPAPLRPASVRRSRRSSLNDTPRRSGAPATSLARSEAIRTSIAGDGRCASTRNRARHGQQVSVTTVYVALGGAAGVLARYALGTAVAADTLPWLTVAINVAGSFLLGCLVTAGDRFSPELRTGLAVGLLGGFTTYSNFAVQIFVDLESGNGGKATAYFLASVVLGVGAAAA